VSSVFSLPPQRDLPPGRSAQRAQHLRTEIASARSGSLLRPTRVLVLAALGLLAVLLATPAFGLRDRVVHLFAADEQQPPELIRRYFRNQAPASRGTDSASLPAKARVALAASVPGFGNRTLWVAPTKAGGYCSTWLGCDARRVVPFRASIAIAGPTSRNSAPAPRSSNVHVFISGQTILHSAATAVIAFEDGDAEQARIVWVARPIDAGFFFYVLPKAHWKVGERPVAIVLHDAKGKQLARDTKAARDFRDAQRSGLAPPPESSHWLWFALAIGVAVVVAAAPLARRRR
jgi:hypothetical protein